MIGADGLLERRDGPQVHGLGLVELPLQAVDAGQVVRDHGDLTALRAVGLLGGSQRLHEGLLRLRQLVLKLVEHRKVLQRGDDVRARRVERGPEDLERAQAQLLGLGEATVLGIERCQVVECDRQIPAVRTLHRLVNIDRLPIGALGLGNAQVPLEAQPLGDERRRKARRLRVAAGSQRLGRLLAQSEGFLAVAGRVELQGARHQRACVD